MSIRLGVNIDHVATLRQARGVDYPSVVDAANIVLTSGADQITMHLREDRRHIQDTDVEAVKLVNRRFGRPLNLEMGCNKEITEIACALSPEWVCLVPENRLERTTEGGLNLIDELTFMKVKETMQKIKESGNTKISLFLEADELILQKAFELLPDAIEIHTGCFANAFLDKNIDECEYEMVSFRKASKIIKEKGIGCHAGHGLTNESVIPLLKENLFEEYNIGHWIIAQAVFDGLGTVVVNMKELFKKFG